MKISVIITSYNQKNYLREAIESVLKQTLLPYEIIIVDDCSSDGSQDMILDYARRYPDLIIAFCHEKGLGIPKNRNFALRQVRGDLISFLDGDDRFLPSKLELELETLQRHPEASTVFSNIYYIDEHGQRTGLWAERDAPPSGYVLKETFSLDWPKGHTYRNELMTRDALEQVGFYDEELHIWEDWDMRIRFTSRFTVAYCPIPLVEYRQHPKGISMISSRDLHISTMKMTYERNRHLLQNLSARDRKDVKRKVFAILLLLEAQAAFERGRRGDALKKYVALAWNNPFAVAGWMILLGFLLGNRRFRLVRAVIGKMRKSKLS
ncbi:MAG TPA: glycosyltransferase [Dehalococcoidia bacterium]|nr:glycosyltransferase [Dehalococcoidia bacterium]